MKRISIFILIVFVQVTYIVAQNNYLKITNPDYLDLQNTNERIDKVISDKTKTLVYLSCAVQTNSTITVPTNTYIIDEKGNKYGVTKANGIVLGKKQAIEKGNKLSYILTFPPLPKGTKSFDLIQSNNLTKTCFFNIHQSGAIVNIVTAIDTTGVYDAINKTFPDSLFRKDSVHISGCFKGSKVFAQKKHAITFVSPIPAIYFL